MTTKIEKVMVDEPYEMYLCEQGDVSFVRIIDTDKNEKLEKRGLTYQHKYLFKKKLFTDNGYWEIAKYLFKFLWDSDNGITTIIDREFYTDDYSVKTMKSFVEWFSKQTIHTKNALEFEGDSLIIYGDYLTFFNLNDVFEKEDK